MKVTEGSLRANYESLDTERLLELRARGTLTETAMRVLEQVLDHRSISAEERVRSKVEVEKRVAEERAMIASLASVGERVGAQLIDSFLALAILVLSLLISIAVPVVFVAGGILFFGYLLFADGLPRGQSIGKRTLGIAVVDQSTRRPCTYIRSFLRNFLLMLLGIIDWLFIFGRTRQRLGDMAASTIVVRLKPREDVQQAPDSCAQQSHAGDARNARA